MNINIEHELKFLEDIVPGVWGISLVSNPATGILAMQFADQKAKTLKLQMANEEKQILVAPVLIPQQRIYRNDVHGAPSNVFASAETIEQLQLNFFKQQNNHNSTVGHDPNSFLKDVFFFESWIIEDFEMDKAKALGFDPLPKGTWMASMKIEDKPTWEKYVKQGIITGFSIDALLLTEKKEIKQEIKLSQMKKLNLKEMVQGAISQVRLAADVVEISVGDKTYIASALAEGELVLDSEGSIVTDSEFEYEGKIYKTDSEGLISSIEDVEVEEPIVPVEEAVEDVPAEPVVEDAPVEDTDVQELKDKIVELESANAELRAELEKVTGDKEAAIALANETPASEGVEINLNKELKYAKGSLLEVIGEAIQKQN